MWFILQGAIIFGVFCWIGQHVDYAAEPEMKKAAGMLGGIVAFAVTYALSYAADCWHRFLHRLTQPRPPKAPQWKPKTGRELVREYQTARRTI
jgi:hypothetical protein